MRVVKQLEMVINLWKLSNDKKLINYNLPIMWCTVFLLKGEPFKVIVREKWKGIQANSTLGLDRDLFYFYLYIVFFKRFHVNSWSWSAGKYKEFYVNSWSWSAGKYKEISCKFLELVCRKIQRIPCKFLELVCRKIQRDSM